MGGEVSSSELFDLKEDLAKEILLSLDKEKKGILSTFVDLGVSLNPMYTSAKKFITGESEDFGKINKFKQFFIENFFSSKETLSFDTFYDITFLTRLRNEIFANSTEKDLLDLKQKIQDASSQNKPISDILFPSLISNSTSSDVSSVVSTPNDVPSSNTVLNNQISFSSGYDFEHLTFNGKKLLFLEKVKENRELFGKKVLEISQRLFINPNWLMWIMNKESGLNHKAVNPHGGATGLIQFMPKTAKGLGTSCRALKKMSNIEQLDYVEKYYIPYLNKIRSANDLYLLTFYPKALREPKNYVIGSQEGRAELVGKQNNSINGGKPITVGDFEQWFIKGIPDDYRSDFLA